MRTIFFLILIFFSFKASTQNISGEWYGWANLNSLPDENNYMISLDLKQNDEAIEGIMTIYYMNEYRKIPVFGVFSKSDRSLLISDVNLPMHFYDLPNFGKIEIDAYLEAKLINARQINQIKGFLISKTIKNLNNINFVLVKPYVFETTYYSHQEPSIETYKVPMKSVPKVLITNDIPVFSDSVSIDLYDGSIIDNDTVTLVYNDKVILQSVKLSLDPIHLMLYLDPKAPTHLITLRAENLGTIPPNTGVMILYDGETRHEVFFSNSMMLSTGVILTKGAR